MVMSEALGCEPTEGDTTEDGDGDVEQARGLAPGVQEEGSHDLQSFQVDGLL
jgi:hypothetical protein